MLPRTSEEGERTDDNDIFARREEEQDPGSPDGDEVPALKLPERFDDLPIEIRSLTERYGVYPHYCLEEFELITLQIS